MKTLKGLICALVLLTVMPSRALTVDEKVVGIAFYVSPAGNDSQTGTSIDKPFATLTRVRDAIRELKLEGELKLPVTVYLLDGTYKLSEPFILNTEDSGTEACPITFLAYEKAKPIISGARAPLINQLVILQGDINAQKYVQFVNFSGLTFCDVVDVSKVCDQAVENKSKPAAIAFDGTKFCTFENNCIRNTVSHALEICGDANKITNNKIYNIGGGGIISRSYGKEFNRISYNEIHNCGTLFHSACAIHVADGGGEIAHNFIHDISSCGIYAGPCAANDQQKNQEQALLIEYNEIHRVMLKTNDGGAITVRDSNTLIRNNFIYDVYTNSNGDPSVFGIYLGDRTSYTLIENNIIDRATAGIYIGNSNKQNTIVNNFFINIQDHVLGISDSENQVRENIRFIKNILYSTHSDVCIYILDKKLSLPTESDYNIYWNPYECFTHNSFIRINNPLYVNDFKGVEFFFEWQKMGFDEHSIVWNPNFENVSEGDYTLKPDSPAFRLGFKPIDMKHVGLDGAVVGPVY